MHKFIDIPNYSLQQSIFNCAILFALLLSFGCVKVPDSNKVNKVDTCINIFPEYNGITIPNNIAPLNFKINTNSTDAVAVVESKAGKIVVKAKGGIVQWPESKWHILLQNSLGDTLKYTIYVNENKDNYALYKPFTQVVSPDSIDEYMAYRLINTGYVLWEELGIYQRHLGSFNEDAIIDNTSIKSACVNCHSFSSNNPEAFMLHTRKSYSGTNIMYKGMLKKIETKTNYTLSSGVYPSWHPNGKIIAMSVNRIGQQFHAMPDKRITVSDAASDIILYNVETNTVTTSPKVSTQWRENLPVWSPCGNYLYYISAPQRKVNPAPVDAHEPYSLLRITYNVETNEWGEADTLIAWNNINGSVSFPKPSPDGNYLVFTKANNGYFTIHDNTADLYLLNLRSGEISKPEINSDYTDSYHSWSSNGRWMVLSSKRMGGLFTRPFFAHFNEQGEFSKPFVLPQKNPDYYNSYLYNYNIPELIKGKVKLTQAQIRDLITSDAIPAEFDKSINVDALSGATAKK